MPNRYEWMAVETTDLAGPGGLSRRLQSEGWEVFAVLTEMRIGETAYILVIRRFLPDEHAAATCPDCLSELVEDPFAEADTLPVGQTMAQTQADMDLEFAQGVAFLGPIPGAEAE